MQGTHNRLLQWLRLGIIKNGREKTNRRKKLNISANSKPLKASDRNVGGNLENEITINVFLKLSRYRT